MVGSQLRILFTRKLLQANSFAALTNHEVISMYFKLGARYIRLE